MGDVTLAANAVLLNLVMFMAYGLDGFAHAAEALVGSAIGARDRGAFRGAVRASTLMALATAAGLSLAYALTGPLIIDALTGVAAVRAAAREVLPWLIAAPLLSVWAYQLDGIFIGAVRTGEMRNAMIVSLVLYLAAIELLRPLLGNHGLWLALMLFMVARGVTLGALYPRIERGLAAGG